MKRLLSSLLLCFFFNLLISQSLLEKLHFERHKMPIGQSFLYQKSNLDDSRMSHIMVYMSDSVTLESFKWFDQHPGGSLVKATVDWSIFSIKKFQSYNVNENGAINLKAELVVEKEKNRALVEVIGQFKDTVSLNYFPWQSYDFDFAALSVLMPFLQNANESFEFMITDLARTDKGLSFKEIGVVKMEWIEKANKFSFPSNKYKIDGPGLDHRGGFIWFDLEGHLIGFEIEKPDEPGYESGKLKLVKKEKMTPKDWKNWVKHKAQ